MAGEAVTPLPSRRASMGVLIACAAIGAISGIFRPLDAQHLNLWQAVRGERAADSSIVLCYIDDDAVRTLGWPVPRNFHALMVRVLTELGARGIGLDIVFEDRRSEYPEYDDLLARVAGASGMTVVPAYFDRLGVAEPAAVDTSVPLDYPGVGGGVVAGAGAHLPFPGLRAAVAGIGHVNLESDGGVPLIVQAGPRVVPAFALELLRVSMGSPPRGLWYDGGSVAIRAPDQIVRFRVPGGVAHLNHPGNISAYRSFPFLEILRAYDRARQNLSPRLPLESFRGKTVLIAVVAEGRSRFVPTPVGAQTPSVLLHAAFLDNALGGRFLTFGPWWLVVLASLGAGAVCLVGMPFTKAPYHWIVPVLTIAGAALVSYLLFVWGAYYLPVLPMIFAAAVGAAPALLDRRRGALSRVRALEQEREHILARLHSREERVAALERELASSGQGASPERVQALLDEVEKTREEIRSLSSRADDMTPFAHGGTGGGGAADEFEGLVFARGGPLRRVVDFIRRIAPSDAPVMILGESGTGKELVARAIHRLSPRAVGPFVPVNCGALAENLLESELFGHERGAFTGAVRERAGRFETADGGTIFLDEIAETSEGFQVKLLRVLQEGEFERVGGSSTVRVNVRVLAATNRDIRSAVREGRFREDLYYRLNVLTVSLPPLRDRPDDIFHLAQRFVEREGGHLSLSTNVMGALRLHSWPGNVRELESTLRRAVLLASSEGRNIVSLKDLPEEIASASRLAIPLEAQIMESVRRKGFSRRAVSETAEELGGLNRGTVAEYLRGEFLTAFLDGQFDAEKAVTAMAQSPDPGVHTRVQKRLLEYLENLTGGIDRGGPWESVSLRPKLKNLPQRYHASAETIAEAYHRRQWDHPANRTGSSPGIP